MGLDRLDILESGRSEAAYAKRLNSHIHWRLFNNPSAQYKLK